MREVKEAYKVLIKQNHPDRVHDMSPAFKTLAEAETKKLNAAYRQALLCVPFLRSKCHVDAKAKFKRAAVFGRCADKVVAIDFVVACAISTSRWVPKLSFQS